MVCAFAAENADAQWVVHRVTYGLSGWSERRGSVGASWRFIWWKYLQASDRKCFTFKGFSFWTIIFDQPGMCVIESRSNYHRSYRFRLNLLTLPFRVCVESHSVIALLKNWPLKPLTLKWLRYFYSRWCLRGFHGTPWENHFLTGILQWNLHHICTGHKKNHNSVKKN